MKPSAAEIARTLVASAQVGTLTTYPARPPAPPRPTLVSLDTDAMGQPVIKLSRDAAAPADLLARPLATVTVAASGTRRAVVIHGAARLLARSGERGRLAYQVGTRAVRLLDPAPVPIDVDAYAAAEPDPLRLLAPTILAHLADNHTADLTACARAHGVHTVAWVQPRALDRYGLELAVVDDDGVSRLRLPFPRRLHNVTELDPGLRAVLCCHCRRHRGDSPHC